MHDTLMMRLRRGLQHRTEPGAQQGEGRRFRSALTLRQIELPDDLETVFAFGTNPQRKHLLHQMVKEVRVHGRRSVEVTDFVPQPDPGGSPVRTQPHMAPQVARCTNRDASRERAEFRVLHGLRVRTCARGTRSAVRPVWRTPSSSDLPLVPAGRILGDRERSPTRLDDRLRQDIRNELELSANGRELFVDLEHVRRLLCAPTAQQEQAEGAAGLMGSIRQGVMAFPDLPSRSSGVSSWLSDLRGFPE